MYEELISRLKILATLEVKNGESVIHVTAEATAAIREIAQEAADAIEELEEKAQALAEKLYAYEHPSDCGQMVTDSNQVQEDEE